MKLLDFLKLPGLMKTSIIILVLLLCISSFSVSSQEKTEKEWNKALSYLIGDWTGEGTGKPGEGSGYFSFKYSLDSNIIVRNSHSEYPPSKDKPGIIHDDLLVIYKESSDSFNKAIYYDNEGHVIHYNIAVSDDIKSIIFNGEQSSNQPVFRLIYKIIDENKVNISFEFALPDKPDSFKTYLEGTSVRKK
jgi:hypothetical protein